MADAAHDSLDSLFNAPNRFRRAIQRQAGL